MYCHRYSYKCNEDFTKPCCKNHLSQIVHYLSDLFDKEKIFYWMHFGTLLSAVRDDGEVIPWDSDADIGTTASKQRFYALKDKIEADGYSWSVNHEYLIQIGYSELNWAYCDVWLYDRVPSLEHGVGDDLSSGLDLAIPLDMEPINSREEVLRCRTPWMQVNHTCDFPFWFVEEVEQRSFEGKLLNCPRHPERFLEFLYGPGWKEPEKKDKSGYCGNYYPLSHWLDYVELQRELKQPINVLRESPAPYCRIDTEKCEKPNKNCCGVHKKEMMNFLSKALVEKEVSFRINFDENYFMVKAENFGKVSELKELFNTYYNAKFYRNKIHLYYSKINRNKIIIYFNDSFR